MLQQFDTRDPAKAFFSIGEMPADVSQTRGPQQRITDRMKKNICIGMSEQSPLGRDLHASENKLPPVGESMNVISQTDPGECADV
jgi:hypothetical protein